MTVDHDNKLGVNQFIESTGVIGDYNLEDNDFIRVTIENANGGNTIDLYVRLDGQTTWKLVKSISGADSGRVDTNSYDELQIRCSVLDGTNVKLLASGFKRG